MSDAPISQMIWERCGRPDDARLSRMLIALLGPIAAEGDVWIRSVVDLVHGKVMSPLERLFSVADDANGVGAKLISGRGRPLKDPETVALLWKSL